MAKPQKPLHQKSHEEFPYRLEKPSTDLGHLHEIDRNDNFGAYVEKVAIADTPIAIAYSPTEPNPYRNMGQKKYPHNLPQFSNPNSASQVIPEIRDENEFEADSRGQNYEKDFQAPFYPSMSLNSATPNGWSYEVTSSPTSESLLDKLYQKNNINRSDKGEKQNEPPVIEAAKAKVNEDGESFFPELQGGFKPIYPPGYKEEDEQSLISKKVEEASNPESTTIPNVEQESSTQFSNLISSTTTEKPKIKVEKKKEPSLADILFGSVDDEEEEVEEIES